MLIANKYHIHSFTSLLFRSERRGPELELCSALSDQQHYKVQSTCLVSFDASAQTMELMIAVKSLSLLSLAAIAAALPFSSFALSVSVISVPSQRDQREREEPRQERERKQQ